MAFVRKAFIVSSGAWRETGHVKHFRSKAKDDVLPSRRVESNGPICVPVGLCCESSMVEYSGFKRNEKRRTGVEVTPGPAMEKEGGGKGLGEGEFGDGKFHETGGPVNSGAEFPL